MIELADIITELMVVLTIIALTILFIFQSISAGVERFNIEIGLSTPVFFILFALLLFTGISRIYKLKKR